MTLILNEIHLLNGLNKTMLVAAADSRISMPDGPPKKKKKLFPIPYLNGAISYFGLATFPKKGKTEPQFLSDWLPNFINGQSEVPDLQTFAESLRVELNKEIPPAILTKNPSGFHICGYNSQGLPEFWYLTNIERTEHFQYLGLKSEYAHPTPDFLGRDAREKFEWDGSNPSSAKNGIQFYRNGDFRAHVALWETLDEAFSILLQSPNFKRPSTLDEYEKYVRFKFEVIAYFYKKWAKKVIIAGPIDVLICSRPGAEQDDSLIKLIINNKTFDTRGPFYATGGSTSYRALEGILNFSTPYEFTGGSAIAHTYEE